MCGIAGWLTGRSAALDAAALERMLEAMRHRGPDDRGTYTDDAHGIALGHNRLSIIDLSNAGHQPMVHAESGIVLSFNGEIYNFRELRRTLEASGTTFRSHSDSEVLLQAFVKWGVACVSRLRGMFAFAVWSPREGTLHLVRDPLGMKPLYYWIGPTGALVFASEIKAFLGLPGFRVALDARALRQYLEFGYGFEPERTILKDVHKLPPGHTLRLRRGATPAIERYFEPPKAHADAVPRGDLEQELFETLSTVVAEHLVADVPVGLLLSGGLDSSLIAALAARASPIRTFTMAFASSKIDEREPAAKVAAHIGSRHEEIMISPEEITSDMSQTARHFDDLFADWGTISTRLLYQRCRNLGIKVVIVGEGADELFGGYDTFRRTDGALPIELWLFKLYRFYAGRRYGTQYPVFRRIMRQHMAATGGDRFSAIRLFESQNQLPTNYVMKVDKASMSVSVEARAPFLDRRVAELAYALPESCLLTGDSNKEILRRMAQRFALLPEEIVRRPKFGASIAASWMDEEPAFRSFARTTILARGSWTEALGLRRAMIDYYDGHKAGYAFPSGISIFRNLAWRLLLLELWSQALGIAPHAR